MIDLEKQITFSGSPSAKERERRELAEKIKAFKRGGGKIQKIETGVGVGSPGIATKAGRRATYAMTVSKRQKQDAAK